MRKACGSDTYVSYTCGNNLEISYQNVINIKQNNNDKDNNYISDHCRGSRSVMAMCAIILFDANDFEG